MAGSGQAPRPGRESTFGRALREWRTRRGLSQLALAGDAGVSSRHLSFVETGRAQASREMVLLLARALDVPLRDRNRPPVGRGLRAGIPCDRSRGPNVSGWPSEKSAQKLCAEELAARATLKLAPAAVSGSPPPDPS